MTDFRALCARMADELDEYRQLLLDDRSVTHRLADEARAALAQPEPEGPTDEELAKTAMGAVENYRYATELPYFLSEDSSEYEPFMLILRAVLDRWGNNTSRSN